MEKHILSSVFSIDSCTNRNYPTAPYQFVVGAVFKNENHILKEWIEHYYLHGAEHIYLINDESSDDFMKTLLPYIKQGYVTLFHNKLKIDTYPRQTVVYHEYFRPVLSTSKWWTILDLDEFLYHPDHIDIKKGLDKYNDDSQLFIKWTMFGSNGHIEQPKLVVPSFTKRWNELSQTGKTIFQSVYLQEFGVHYHELSKSFIFIDDFVINHYAIQSWKFFERTKMTRGDVNNYAPGIRDRKYFDDYDKNDQDDIQLSKQNQGHYYLCL